MENSFALAHNGIIYDDMELKKEYRLPQSKVETDSYVAVQLLEQDQEMQYGVHAAVRQYYWRWV